MEKSQDQEQSRAEAESVSLLKQLMAMHGATYNWLHQLSSGAKVRTSPIMSAEVQQAWQTGRPLLFVGVLEDVARNEDGTYQLTVKHAELTGEYLFLANQFYLTARCPATVAKPLMDMAANPARIGGLQPDAALVGTVGSVMSKRTNTSDGDSVHFVGVSDCLAAKPVNQLPTDWSHQLRGER